MKKLLLGLLLVAGIALALVAFLVSRLDSEALGARLIQQINQQSGIQLEAESFSLHPLRGLELTDARATGRLESGEIQAEVALVRMHHRVVPLLRGELVIHEVLLREPQIELLARSAEEVRQQKAAERRDRRQAKKAGRRQRKTEKQAGIVEDADHPEDPLRLSIRSMAIENGSLSIRPRDRDEASFELEELNLLLEGLAFDPGAPSSTEAVTGAGRLTTGRVLHGDLEATETRGEIRIAGGIADVTELEVRSANSNLMVNRLTIRLLQEPPSYSVEAAGSLDLNGLLGFDDGDGFGPVVIELGAAGEGPELEEMIGEGTLILNGGAIPGIPSVVQIEELVGQPILTGRQYARSEIDYQVRANKIVLEPFQIVGEGAEIGGSGEIDLAGPLALDISVRLPARGLEMTDMTEEQLASMADEGGQVTVPFHVSGTIDDPAVALTWDGMKALASDSAKSWAEEALEEAKKRAAEWLKSQAGDREDG